MPPGRLALADGRREWTYGELRAAVTAEAEWLAQTGGRRFALLADNGGPWILSDLALLERELPCVPIPGSFTPAQLGHLLEDAGIDHVLTDEPERLCALRPDLAAAGQSPRTGLTLLRRLPVPAPTPLPAGTIKVTYTSGSTAAPKGVCLDAATLGAVAHALAGATGETLGGPHLCVLPLATLLENVAGVHVALRRGATCLAPSCRSTGMSYGQPDPQRLLEAISQARPASLILVPELLRALVAGAGQGWRPPASLRFVAVGGAAVAPTLLARAAALGLPVYEGYGLSECGSVVCLNTPLANRPGSVGRPLPHVRVRLDEQGQLMVSGATSLGYLGQPGRRPGELATGDLAEIDAEGFVSVRGRLRNLFITSLGRNISPEWVERELTAEPEIGRVVAIGEARPYVVALLSAADQGAAGSLGRAIARANARLPDYAQVRRWALLPSPLSVADGTLTANGRLRREDIERRYAPLIDSLYADAQAS